MQKYANPTKFYAISGKVLPWTATATVIAFAIGLYMSLVTAPQDYQQGETVRIMFVHVPAAWMAMFGYTAMALASAVGLIWRHPLADVAAKCAPMWGAWWVWDARLTSVFVLFLLYLGYMAIWQAIEEPLKAARVAAIVALVGFVNIPIIKFSVDWWNSLHQPASVLRADGPAIHPDILTPLLIMGLAYALLFITLHLISIRAEIIQRRIRAIEIAEVQG